MDEFFSRKTIIIALIAILLALVLAIVSAVSGGKISPIGSAINIIVSPVQKACTKASEYFSDRANRVLRYEDMKAENERLRGELAAAKSELRTRDAMAKENAELRAALNMKERDASYVFEPAEIVAKNADNWTRSFTINKGESSGVAVDNCVITVDGMVGFVSEVGSTWATVTAITDTTMEAAVIASRTRDVASAEGDFELMADGMLKMSYLPRNTQMLAGDVIETSGMGGLFPKGIVIGSVAEVKNETHGISKYATIKPAVDLDHVNNVLIIKSFKITE